MHANRVLKLLDSIDDSVSVDDQLLKAFADDLHIAMYSNENAEMYLSEIADHLVTCLLDDSRIAGHELDSETPAIFKSVCSEIKYLFVLQNNWPSEACRHFLRQLVLSTILYPILEFITNPGTLNLLFITALEPKKQSLENVSKVGRTYSKTEKREILGRKSCIS